MARILIVEDEYLFASLLRKCLLELNFEVGDPIPTGEGAINSVLKEKPDLILMDVNLGGRVNGVEAAERILVKMSVPIIFITGFSDKNLEERAKKLKPLAYLNKPVPVRQVLQLIEETLKVKTGEIA